ncbi:hypothetical protein G8768_20325 [Pseudoteredinibacter isoporae]|uniref:Ubiquinone/menaquinone biosynthesis C-methylase UbiE n=1 Tax=Pseudoteredinibacter isoporae TaxID=570281 RepID=A0A7X0JWZ8_9GAMM|nr:hypothetical protein [Pseudoteredinibacter isoporae]MBB6523790.1 ubiquinone/menaquinone biosynthesis C-methylase UbiE [Pseudoteredinibacter isoporae]NHO89310.1 hypothetical protein [Pseudoteredinibacter isoporae]NIB22417.1 hypothetical protein [Pseudoteredinibacter isoporae]
MTKESECYTQNTNWKYSSALFSEKAAEWPEVKPYVSEKVLASVARDLEEKANTILTEFESHKLDEMSESETAAVFPELFEITKRYIEVNEELKKYKHSYLVSRNTVIVSAFTKAEREMNSLARSGEACLDKAAYIREVRTRAFRHIRENVNNQRQGDAKSERLL